MSKGCILCRQENFDPLHTLKSSMQYQNCLRRFYYNTDPQILLYLARTHYEAEQWQECKQVLLHAIHLAPSNYTLRFDAAIAMQKFSTATLKKTKRSAEEVSSALVSCISHMGWLPVVCMVVCCLCQLFGIE
jgi:uncharacterized protein HemY